jgi:mannan endo-1,4-beta-mannosidase
MAEVYAMPNFGGAGKLIGMSPLFVAYLMACQASPLRLEAEQGTLNGVQVASERKGYSGTGYVTGFDSPGDAVVLRFEARAGIFDAVLVYCAANGEKGFEVAVNGVESSGMLRATSPACVRQSIGKVELRNGQNEIRIEKGWGYYDVDAIELSLAPPPKALKKVPGKPADPLAGREARELLKRLALNYGKSTLSGQYEIRDSEYIAKTTGKTPVVLGGDLMEYSPSRRARGADPNDAVEKLIAKAKKGQILTISWHWNAPTGLIDKMIKDSQGRDVDARWYKGFYTNASTFDLARTLSNPSGHEYRLLLRDIDTIAVQLKKFAAAKVPILWRPLHEAEGGWFWWGAKGPEPYKTLWKLMFDRLHNRHKLHKLLWVHNCLKPDWYPGDRYVDLIGVDAYPSDKRDALSGSWESLLAQFDGRKLLALTEFGGVPDIDRAWRFGVRWSFFVSWVGTTGAEQIAPVELKRLYSAKRMRSR